MASKSNFFSLPFIILVLLQNLGTSQISTTNQVDLDDVAKTIWVSGSHLMSRILKGKLASMEPYRYGDFGLNNTKNIAAIYNKNSTSIFPPDDAIFHHEDWVRLEYQIVTWKHDTDGFGSDHRLYEDNRDYFLFTCIAKLSLITEEYSGYPVKLIRCGIYNNGHEIVHGVEDFKGYAFISNIVL